MNPTAADVDRAAQRAQLRDVVACLARQIDDGSLPIVETVQFGVPGIDVEELQRLATLCEARGLDREAARIRRWLAV